MGTVFSFTSLWTLVIVLGFPLKSSSVCSIVSAFSDLFIGLHDCFGLCFSSEKLSPGPGGLYCPFIFKNET